MAEPYLATCPTCGDQHRAERWRDVQEQSKQRQRERDAWALLPEWQWCLRLLRASRLRYPPGRARVEALEERIRALLEGSE
jgi:DNA repair exonuclease SbcCD ATPase subunit